MTSAATIVRLIDNGHYLSAIRNLTRERKQNPEIGIPVAEAFLDADMWFEAVKILRFHKDSDLWAEVNEAKADSFASFDAEVQRKMLKEPEYLVAKAALSRVVDRFPKIQAPALLFTDTNEPILHWMSARVEITLTVLHEEDPYVIDAFDYLTQEQWTDRAVVFSKLGEATMAWFMRLIYD